MNGEDHTALLLGRKVREERFARFQRCRNAAALTNPDGRVPLRPGWGVVLGVVADDVDDEVGRAAATDEGDLVGVPSAGSDLGREVVRDDATRAGVDPRSRRGKSNPAAL
jgi:hypothetical protein